MAEWTKTLIIALVSSFFAVCFTEPVKALIQQWIRKRQVRRSLYQEMVHNYHNLHAQVAMANNEPEMKSGIGVRFAMGFKKLSLELAQRDPVTYYSLGRERYWIELLYDSMEHIITGTFTDDNQHLGAASFTAEYLLSNMKNRQLDRRLIFQVSSKDMREHFRELLPKTAYIDPGPPRLLERIRRRLD